MISVSIVDDEKELRQSITTFVSGSPGFKYVSAYGSAEAALKGLPTDQTDVVLMDINLGGMSGIECVEKLKAIAPALQILMLTVYEDTDQIFKALAAGASGYLLKRSPAAATTAITAAKIRTLLNTLFIKFYWQTGNRQTCSVEPYRNGKGRG